MVNRGPNRAGNLTRQRLLTAGLAEFHARGFSATGVDQIAKTAGVPKGSFYNLFASKEAFAAEVIELYFEKHHAKLCEFFDDVKRSPLDRMRGYFDERTEFFAKLGFQRGCLMGNLSLETADQSEAMRLCLAENFRIWSSIFGKAIAQAQSSGHISSKASPMLLAEFILNSWEGAILRMRAERSVKPLKEAKAVIFNHILV